jgi:putative transposase
MGRIKLQPNEPVRYNGDDYEIAKVVDFDQVIIRHRHTAKTLLAQIDDLQSKDLSDKTVALAFISDEHWEIAKKRFEIIEPLLGRKRTKKEVLARAKKFDTNHVTLYTWIKAYEESHLLSALLPNYGKRGGKGKTRLDKQVDIIIDEVINEQYLTKQRLAVKYIHKEIAERCKSENLKVPHINTIRNRIDVYPERVKMHERHGYNASRYKYNPAPGKFEPLLPLEVIQIDHTQVDIFVVDENNSKFVYRPYITVALDIQSRMVYGFYLSYDPPNMFAAGQSIYMGALRKTAYLDRLGVDGKWIIYGLPQNVTIATDNAKEFRGKDIKRFCEQYKIHDSFRPRKTPHYGGHIERFIGTLNNMLHSLPGTTFSSSSDKGDYNAMEHATLTLKKLEEAIVNFIVNIYHEEMHSDISMSPSRKFMEGVLGNEHQPGIGWPDIFEGEAASRLKMELLPSFRRSIQRMGVTFEGIRYFSDSIRSLINIPSSDPEGYIFKYDPRDLSMIYFYHKEHNEYFSLPCRNLNFPSISIWELRRVRDELKRRNEQHINEETIASGYRYLQEIRKQSLAKKSEKSSKRIKSSNTTMMSKKEHLQKDKRMQQAIDNERKNRRKTVKIYDVEHD